MGRNNIGPNGRIGRGSCLRSATLGPLIETVSDKDEWPKEKQWKDLSVRSEKVHRARQLGFEHNKKGARHRVISEPPNLLFVCSKNQWRSPTGEKVFDGRSLINTRSAGTSPRARHTVTLADIKWADIILVMERKHAQRLRANFPEVIRHKELHVLDIEDRYQYMAPELVAEITAAMEPILAAK